MTHAGVAKRPQSSANDRPDERIGPPGDQDSPRLVTVLGRRGLLRVSGNREQRIAAIARLQRGHVTRQQLLAAGLSPTAIKNMIRRRLLEAKHSGVDAVAYAPPVPLAQETAALLACGNRAVLSHRSAAALWGLIAPLDGSVDVTITGVDRGRKRGGINAHRAERLLPRDLAIHQGLPVTSPARTALDAATGVPMRVAAQALDEALVVLAIVRPGELTDALERAGRRRGTRVFRELLTERGGGGLTESEAERRFLALIRKAGLRLPESQVPFGGYRIDFL